MDERTSNSPMGRRFDEDKLLDAARQAFHQDSYSAAQINDIAQRAGTTKPTLYARLGDKPQIYHRVIQREADVFLEWIEHAYSHGSELPIEQHAYAGMEPLFRFAAERPEGYDLLFRGDRIGNRPDDPRREILTVVTAQLAALIERRHRDYGIALPAPADALAAACVGVALQVCDHALDHRSDLADAHRIAAQFVANALSSGSDRRSAPTHHD